MPFFFNIWDISVEVGIFWYFFFIFSIFFKVETATSMLLLTAEGSTICFQKGTGTAVDEIVSVPQVKRQGKSSACTNTAPPVVLRAVLNYFRMFRNFPQLKCEYAAQRK